MGVFSGPDISESGLVLALDGGNYKSFKGEVTTNLIPSPTINAYPTTGNGWGTYNTNQYSAGNFFSIGTVSNITNNIVTMTSAHGLRTYDVMRPQSTGGGVIANTDYFIKKLSDTSFTLHAYNSSQDGSQGYISSATGTHKVYDSIATDARISVNASGFPTMWWGAPHLPNSGLVKELRYGEFNAIPNLPPNDCIRLHYIRTDDVKDGMSYGVDCTVTPNSPVTVSFYTRSANANAVGKVIQYYIYNYSGGNPTAYAWNFTLGPLGVWQRQTFTYTPANGIMISYWFPQSGGVYAWDWSCMQVEQKSYATNFVPGTRGSTVATGGGWADLTGNGNHGTLINGVRESSDNLGALVFDGVDDRVECGTWSASYLTISTWVYKTSSATNQGICRKETGWAVSQYNGTLQVAPGTSWTFYNTGYTIPLNTWVNIVYTYSGTGTTGSQTVYINGSSIYSTSAGSGAISANSNAVRIGYDDNNWFWGGRIAQTQIYNRALTAAEVQQNFNANRSRFGI